MYKKVHNDYKINIIIIYRFNMSKKDSIRYSPPSIQFISPITRKSRKEYYRDNALKAYKEDIKTYKDYEKTKSIYSYDIINEFLQINNVNDTGINLINYKLTKVNKEKAKNIIEIVKSIDKQMMPYTSRKPLYKGLTHISKKTLDFNNTPLIYKAFNSTTHNYDVAASFANAGNDDAEFNILLILSVSPDIKSYDYHDIYNEAEILLERNTILSNFVYNTYDRKNKVHVYNAIVSKYMPVMLYFPKNKVDKFLNLKTDKTNKSSKLMKLFDINKKEFPY